MAAIAVAAGVAVALSACAGSDSPENGGSAGTHLTIVKALESASLDPALIGASVYGDAATGNAIFDQLFWTDDDGEIHYRLAEDLSSDDGLTWTLALRQGVEFSDGSPFDAEAVKFSWERILDPELGSTARTVAEQIVAIEAVDDHTLRFELAEPNRRFAARIESTGALNWIVSPTAVETGAEAFGLKPVGAGPFVVESWDAGAPVELVRNDGFWEEGLPLLDTISIVSNPDSTTAADMIASGEAQLRTTGLMEGTDVVLAAGGSVVAKEHPGGTLLVLNTARPPFDDVRARQAIAYAMDRRLYNETTYAGLETTTETLFPEGSPYFDAGLRQEEDAERAQELFDELAAEGKPVDFVYLTSPNNSAQGMGQLLTAVLGGYQNVTVDIQSADVLTVGPRLFQGDFDASISGAFGIDPDIALFEPFRIGGQSNFGRWADEEATAALTTARTSGDADEISAAYRRFQEIFVEQVPAVVLVRSGAVVSLAPGVDGVILPASGFPILTEATYTP